MQTLSRAESQAKKCRIACLSDTFGVEANNGVGRFLSDLQHQAQLRDLPLRLVVPSKQSVQPGIQAIRAPSFALPGYPDLKISMPLEHHRKTILHEFKNRRPDVLHVSTPGPLGIFGVSLAKQLRLPLVGIYHTDFPSYARELARSQLHTYQQQPTKSLSPLLSLCRPLLEKFAFPLLQELESKNENLEQDWQTLSEIVQRNAGHLTSQIDFPELAGEVVQGVVAQLLKRFYESFSLVVARSESQQAELEKTLQTGAQRIRCLTPGTDINRFHPKFSQRSLWSELGIPADAFVVLYVGRVTPEKNVDFLLRVWQEVVRNQADTDRDFRLVMVGHGDEKTIAAAKALPQVHLVGALHGEQLSASYASADMLLFPSTTETLGQVGLEAGASGLPVVVSNRGGPQMYVRHDETGFVLPTNNPQLWAAPVFALARNDARRRTLADNARTHIRQRHTLQASLDSYWDIHQEAAELHAKKQTRAAVRQKQSTRKPFLPGNESEPGLLILTDYHAGKKYGSAKEKRRKKTALTKMLELAVTEKFDVVFGGDFGDHGARPERAHADFAMLREVRRDVGLEVEPIFVRGNHDYGYTDAQLHDSVGGCRVEKSLVYNHQATRVTFTHGHILGLNRVQQVIASTQDAAAIVAALREEVLDEELKPSVIAYDVANMIEAYTQQKGLSGLGTFWEQFFKTRGLLAELLQKLSQNAQGKDERTWKLMASLIGSHNDVETAGQLGMACGSWATVFGHTHEPLVRRVRDVTSSNDWPAHVVANAGNMNRKRPTCVVARYPEVCVYQFRSDSGELQVRKRANCEREVPAKQAARTKPQEPLGPAVEQPSQNVSPRDVVVAN